MSIEAKSVGKVVGKPAVRILTDISLVIADGDFVSLTGKSGSGKSTLLYILSSLDTPSEGSVHISDLDISKMPSEDLYQFRNQQMGFVFQFNYLIAELTALENVLMPTRKLNKHAALAPYAENLLEQFGLKDKMKRYPRQLSGGEQQRVAIARALVMKPKYLFADEPTGSLDSTNGGKVMEIIEKSHKEDGTTVILVTHDTEFAKLAKRSIRLVDGRIASGEILKL
jgi:putative ABC transport system ATP-binding protein/lipoprotein-releasing system ATP-binding protein